MAFCPKNRIEMLRKEKMRETLMEILRLVEGWESVPPAIERDLILERLRGLYEMLLRVESELPSPLPTTLDATPAPAPILPTEEPEESPSEEPEEAVEEEEELLPPIEIFDLDEMIPLDEEPLFEEEPLTEPEAEPMADEECFDEEEPEGVAEEISEPESAPEPEPLAEELVEEALEEIQPEVTQEPEPEPEPEPLVEQDEEEPMEEVPVLQNSLFDPAEIPVSRRGSRRAFLSLYGEEPPKSSKRAPKSPMPEPFKESPVVVKEEEPMPPQAEQEEVQELVETLLEVNEQNDLVESPLKEVSIEPSEPMKVVGEVIHSDHLTVADTITPKPNVASTILPEGQSLEEMISLGDSFLMIRELFYDNRDLYLESIERLDRMESLEDCLIYIAENYTWNPNSEGVKRLQELLERKFGEA